MNIFRYPQQAKFLTNEPLTEQEKGLLYAHQLDILVRNSPIKPEERLKTFWEYHEKFKQPESPVSIEVNNGLLRTVREILSHQE
jgi:hypothetical protein